jgi:hypothetical protein
MIRNSPATDLWAWLGEKGRPAGWTAAPGGGRRWSFCSGEVDGTPATRDGWRAIAGAREVEGCHGWACGRLEPELAAAVSNGAGGRLGPWTADARGRLRHARRFRLLYRRRPQPASKGDWGEGQAGHGQGPAACGQHGQSPAWRARRSRSLERGLPGASGWCGLRARGPREDVKPRDAQPRDACGPGRRGGTADALARSDVATRHRAQRKMC